MVVEGKGVLVLMVPVEDEAGGGAGEIGGAVVAVMEGGGSIRAEGKDNRGAVTEAKGEVMGRTGRGEWSTLMISIEGDGWQ